MPLINPKDLHTLAQTTLEAFGDKNKKKKAVKLWQMQEKYKELKDNTASIDQVSEKVSENRVRKSVAKNRTKGTTQHTVKTKNVTTVGPKVNLKIKPKKYKEFLKGKIGWKNKSWKSRGIQLGIALVGFNLFSSTLSSMRNMFNSPVIPKEYDRGYDIIKDNLSDFGSPVKLSKAAGKVMRPYVSMVRRAKYTTVESTIRKNISLRQHGNAIGHGRY